MAKRIALLGITHESNTFVKAPTTLDQFTKGHWLRGEAIRKEYANAFHEIGGMIEVIDASDFELVPVMYAEATPGGTITRETYDTLLIELFNELSYVLPVDACLVVPHGAGVSEAFPDMDGHWLSLLRAKMGNDVPIIGTIDPHANVSPQMISATNALVAYKTNPHVDQREAGKEAARLLVNMLEGKTKPVQAFIQLPLAISIEQQLTAADPCKQLLAYAGKLGESPGILSTSIVLGFPYADVEEMGSSIIVVADQDRQLAMSVAQKLEHHILSDKNAYNGVKQNVIQLISNLDQQEKPVLMLDMGDNVGGGASGDSIYLLNALEQYGKCSYFICIYDPQAVMEASAFLPGSSFDLLIGNNPDLSENKKRKVELVAVYNGQFREETPRHGGQINFDMGMIAIVAVENMGTIMLTSLRVPPYSLRQLTAFGIDPLKIDVLVAKGVNAPIAAYASICKTILQVNTPGVTQADMTQFNYQSRRKPLFPFEAIG